MENFGGSQRTVSNKGSIQLLTTIALIGICLFIILIIILHFLPTGYNPLRRPTSEYAVGKYGFLMAIAFLGMSVGSFALVIGLYKGILKSARPKIGLILLTIWSVGVLVAMIFPIDPEGTLPTTSGTIHKTNGPITFLSLTIGTILMSVGFGSDENWRSVYQPALMLSIIMLFIFIGVIISFATGLRYEGILQRLYLIIFSIWFITVTLHLRQINSVPPEAYK
ncbi:MAG TPA: DUF998 domain-containing protein [Chitinophagaceae bacterium]|nr:DUF998 domain-containing protein [Chitinophagaceae bacterium]